MTTRTQTRGLVSARRVNRRMLRVGLAVALVPAASATWGGAGAVAEAERLAQEARRVASAAPEQAIALARRSVALTRAFDPTDFAVAGRRGEIVEDVFVEARTTYRHHRARVYGAMGRALLASGRAEEAARYLRRAYLLGGEEADTGLATALLSLGRPAEARDLVLRSSGRELTPTAIDLLQQAVDAEGLPSVQVEIDRARLAALPGVIVRYGPIRPPPAARLSTGAPLRFDAQPVTILYLSDAACRTCSRDLEALKRSAAGSNPVLVPPSREDDTTLRRTLLSYRLDWPVWMGDGLQRALEAEGPAAMVVARDGFTVVVVKTPLDPALGQVLASVSRTDVQETRPRARWNRRPPAPSGASSKAPELLRSGLAPGEDDRVPPEFSGAVAAFEAGRPADALRAFQTLDDRGDGFLLPPEAAFNRALCLAALGRADEARRELLAVGDSRFQDAVDRALDRVGSGPTRRD